MEVAVDKPGMDAYAIAGLIVIGVLATSITLIVFVGGQM
jgi:hypothetical protein